jgi:MFS family permease
MKSRNLIKTNNRGRFLFSFSAFHFLDDGFSDSIYLFLPFIAAELNLSFSQVGLLKGIFSGATGLLQFPLSLLGEKIGEFIVIALGTFGLACGFLLLSRAHTFLAILLSLFFAKATGAGQHGLSSSILSRVFEVSGRRAAMGTYNFSGDLGKVCIPFSLALMINLWGWRQATLTLAILGITGVGILYGLAPKQKEDDRFYRSERSLSEEKKWGLKDRNSFSALLTIGIIDMVVRNVFLTFLPFLLLQKGIPLGQAGFALTLVFVGGAAGKFICGVLAERIGIIPMVVGTEIFTAAGILTLMMLPLSGIWALLPFVGIVLNGTSSVLYAMVAEMFDPASRARGYGLYYAVTLGAGAVSPMVFGLLTDSTGLSFTIMMTALMVVLTIPLSRYLSPKP